MKNFSEGQALIKASPSQYINASEEAGGVLLKPHEGVPRKAPIWVISASVRGPQWPVKLLNQPRL